MVSRDAAWLRALFLRAVLMKTNRRLFLRNALAASGLAVAARAQAQHVHVPPQPAAPAGSTPPSPAPSAPATSSSAVSAIASPAAPHAHAPLAASRGVVPVETPDVPHLPWTLDHGVKVFHLIPQPVHTQFLPGREVDAWGFNGSIPGPTIEIHEGDRVRLIVENRLPEMFSMHWHGLEVPFDQDGGPGLSQDPIPAGATFTYEFTVNQHGTFFYHSHFAMQEMMGLIGLFVIHPRVPYTPHVDRDFGLILQEWAILPNNTVPDSLKMEFNWLTLNGKAGPATTPMLVKQGERVRIRMVNLGMDHHPMHLHGNTFYTVGTEAGRIPRAAWAPGNTVLVGVAQARDIEFEASSLGDWMLHCHLPHHMMNQMVSMAGPIMDSDTQAQAVKGYPQDMWMVMDEAFAKPETHMLRPTWSAGMMGMMTLVRVLTPATFDMIQTLKAERAASPPAAPAAAPPPAVPAPAHHHPAAGAAENEEAR
jgi:FtsP/CotA-like multicopper oxidase with cupredoxin domain